MQSKTLKAKVFFFAVAITMSFALFFTLSSCSDVVSSVEDNTTPSYYEETTTKKSLSAHVSNYGGCESEARTILADADTNTYKFYLCGTATGKKHFENITITNGSFSAELPSAYWSLALYAVKSTEAVANAETAKAKALLADYAVADLKNSSAEVSFVLSSKNISGLATLNLTLVTSDNGAENLWSMPAGYKAFAEIQNPLTSAVVAFSNGNTTRTQVSLGVPIVYGGNSEIASGKYNFVVSFYDSDDVLVCTWSDIIVIDPGRKYTSTVCIPNVFTSKPAAPATFTATYVRNSQDDAARYSSGGDYKVHFQWANTPNNELYYELQLLDLETIDHYTVYGDYNGDSYWNQIPPSYIKTIGRDYIMASSLTGGEIDYCDGSLDANKTDITLYLPLGKRYWARIRSVNRAGASAWTYVVLPTGTTEDTGVLATDKVKGYSSGYLEYFVGTATPGVAAKSINMARITYDFNGGTYSVLPSASKKVEYIIQDDPNSASTTAITYFAPAAGTLTKGGKAFLGWSETPAAATPTLVTTYSGYQNKTLYACYEE